METNTPIDFFPGDFSGVSRCSNITIFEDMIVENNEAFTTILKENSSRLEIQNGRNMTQITIIEDDDCKYLPSCERIRSNGISNCHKI